jgi:hypothetical protein
MREFHWSPAEKKAARAAYDAALQTALAKVIAEFKAKAMAVTEPDDMWEIEDYLRQQRRKIDGIFDYRYSQLLFVFVQMIHLGYLSEEQLAGLSDEKREAVHFLLTGE